MKPKNMYELWKNDVISAAFRLHYAATCVGTNGIYSIDEYNAAHHVLWNVLEREPKCEANPTRAKAKGRLK